MSSNMHCFVPNCQSGYPKQRKDFKKSGKRIPSLFSVKQHNNEMLQLWKKAIPRADKEFDFRNKVCELHFQESDIERNYVHQMPDGSIHVLERGHPLLKSGSVPSIFPHLPVYMTKKSQKRKPPAIRTTVTEKKIKEEVRPSDDCTIDDLEYLEEFHLKDNMHTIKLPNSWWETHSTPNYVVCARWNENCIAERKIVITNDLSIKVFLQDRELKSKEKITNADDLSSLIQKVDNYVACAGINDKSYINCLGHLPCAIKHDPGSTWCEECKKVRKQKSDLARRQHASKLVYRSQIFNQRIACAKRKCSRLKQKNEDLKAVLPDGHYQYKILESEIADDGIIATFRSNIQTEEEVNNWLQILSSKLKVEWRVMRTFPNSGRVNVFRKHYRCHHQSHHLLKTNSSRNKTSKVTGCPAHINIKIKNYVKKTRSAYKPSDEERALPCIITFNNCHNHETTTAEALKYRRVSMESRETIIEMLKNGYTPIKAYHAFKNEVVQEGPESHLKSPEDRNVVPDIKYFYNLFYSLGYGKLLDLKTVCPENVSRICAEKMAI